MRRRRRALRHRPNDAGNGCNHGRRRKLRYAESKSLLTLKEVLDRLGGSPVNYIMLAGYNTFRYELGIGRYETASQNSERRSETAAEELNEGAYGISFGIEYDPGITTEEILFAIGVTEDPNLLVSAHYREDCLQDINPVQEMIEIAEKNSDEVSNFPSLQLFCHGADAGVS